MSLWKKLAAGTAIGGFIAYKAIESLLIPVENTPIPPASTKQNTTIETQDTTLSISLDNIIEESPFEPEINSESPKLKINEETNDKDRISALLDKYKSQPNSIVKEIRETIKIITEEWPDELDAYLTGFEKASDFFDRHKSKPNNVLNALTYIIGQESRRKNPQVEEVISGFDQASDLLELYRSKPSIVLESLTYLIDEVSRNNPSKIGKLIKGFEQTVDFFDKYSSKSEKFLEYLVDAIGFTSMNNPSQLTEVMNFFDKNIDKTDSILEPLAITIQYISRTNPSQLGAVIKGLTDASDLFDSYSSEKYNSTRNNLRSNVVFSIGNVSTNNLSQLGAVIDFFDSSKLKPRPVLDELAYVIEKNSKDNPQKIGNVIEGLKQASDLFDSYKEIPYGLVELITNVSVANLPELENVIDLLSKNSHRFDSLKFVINTFCKKHPSDIGNVSDLLNKYRLVSSNVFNSVVDMISDVSKSNPSQISGIINGFEQTFELLVSYSGYPKSTTDYLVSLVEKYSNNSLLQDHITLFKGYNGSSDELMGSIMSTLNKFDKSPFNLTTVIYFLNDHNAKSEDTLKKIISDIDQFNPGDSSIPDKLDNLEEKYKEMK